MKAQGAVKHFEKKAQEAQTDVEAKETILRTTEEEFEVCLQFNDT
jgi:hypothetical protein